MNRPHLKRVRVLPITVVFAAALCCLTTKASAWIYPEHRDIATVAVRKLSPAERAAFEDLWGLARVGAPANLCEHSEANEQGIVPKCIDFAALPAIAGDHSCSPKDVLESVLLSNWVLRVARVGAETKAEIATADGPDEIFTRTATSNLRLQAVDPSYASRAGANNAHFLLPRESGDFAEYIGESLKRGAPLNALGLYLQFHLAALAAAHEVWTMPPGERRAAMARTVIMLEGFALHWLEDSFAAGHAVGTWGADAWRKGTHDYYNEHGYDATTWSGERIVAYGDSNMKGADLARASNAVAISLAQVIAALNVEDPLGVAAARSGLVPSKIMALDTCTTVAHSGEGETSESVASLRPLIGRLPVPGMGPGKVHHPRFRQELGAFVGAYGGVTGRLRWGGLGSSGATPSVSLAAGVRFGFAAPAITGTAGTAKAFVDAGFTMQSSERNACTGCTSDTAESIALLFPRVPSRTGIRVGLRLPFYLLPGDMLLLAPTLLAFSPSTLNKVGVAALSGGLIPYERSFHTRAGVFQVVVGREVDATFYGYTSDVIQVLTNGRDANGDDVISIVSTRSLLMNFPVLEWTPIRSFATNFTFGVPLQAGVSLEVPLQTRVIAPNNMPDVNVGLSWGIFLRMNFEAQNFLGTREDRL